MKIKFFTLILTLFIILSGCTCIRPIGAPHETDKHMLYTGYRNLYYDEETYIVYYIEYHRMSPYYAENGLPYRFNISTNELEIIDYGG